MKKFILMICAVVCAVSAQASMDSETFTLQAIAAATNSRTLVIRGELEAIKVDVVGTTTGTVTVTTAELTAFNKATITADATYLPRYQISTTAGVAITDSKTNDVPAAIYGKIPMAGDVTVRLIGESAVTTNNMIVTLVYKK